VCRQLSSARCTCGPIRCCKTRCSVARCCTKLLCCKMFYVCSCRSTPPQPQTLTRQDTTAQLDAGRRGTAPQRVEHEVRHTLVPAQRSESSDCSRSGPVKPCNHNHQWHRFRQCRCDRKRARLDGAGTRWLFVRDLSCNCHSAARINRARYISNLVITHATWSL
jgi:hypothetical protein